MQTGIKTVVTSDDIMVSYLHTASAIVQRPQPTTLPARHMLTQNCSRLSS